MADLVDLLGFSGKKGGGVDESKRVIASRFGKQKEGEYNFTASEAAKIIRGLKVKVKNKDGSYSYSEYKAGSQVLDFIKKNVKPNESLSSIKKRLEKEFNLKAGDSLLGGATATAKRKAIIKFLAGQASNDKFRQIEKGQKRTDRANNLKVLQGRVRARNMGDKDNRVSAIRSRESVSAGETSKKRDGISYEDQLGIKGPTLGEDYKVAAADDHNGKPKDNVISIHQNKKLNDSVTGGVSHSEKIKPLTGFKGGSIGKKINGPGKSGGLPSTFMPRSR